MTLFREMPAPVPLPQRQDWLRQFMQQHGLSREASSSQWRDDGVQQLLRLTPPTVVFTHFLVINAVVGQVLGRQETLCFWPDNASITHCPSRAAMLELVALGEEMETVVN